MYRVLRSFLPLLVLSSTAHASETLRIEVTTIPINPVAGEKAAKPESRAAKPPVTIMTAHPYQDGLLYQCQDADPDSPLVTNWMRRERQPEQE